MRTGSNIRQRSDGRFEARYEKARDENGHIVYGYCYGNSYQEAEDKRNSIIGQYKVPRQMNLLILGAGICGKEVKELAEQLRVFNRIDFLEDFGDNEGVIGKCSEAQSFIKEYPVAIPAVGDNALREKWFRQLMSIGFIIPTLIHPSANVAHDVQLGAGCIVCAGATIGQNCVLGKGCLISSGAIINRSIALKDFFYADCGEVVKTDVSRMQRF